MTQIKKKIQVTNEVEVDIKLPYFTKTICHHYAIFSENEVWVVTEDSCIEKRNRPDLGFILDKEESTEVEFMEAYKKALENLSQLPL